MDGRDQTFDSVIRPYLADGFGLARFLVRNPADAEDVFQEASIRALRAIAGVRGESPRAWFMAIVRNTAYTWLAKSRAFNVAPVETLAMPAHEAGRWSSCTDANANPELALIERADVAMVVEAIRALPEGLREVVILRDLQGFNYREIAEILGIPLGTVMSRLARGRRRLLRSLGTTVET